MGTFRSEQTFPYVVEDLRPVADDVMAHFRAKGFETMSLDTLGGGVDVSITKGGAFKALAGMKTALKIELAPVGGGTIVRAGIGVFGQQAVPTAITMLILWPVLITQIWGMVQQSKLDEEALSVVNDSLRRHSGKGAESATATSVVAAPGAAGVSASEPAAAFCTSCGTELTGGGKFCSECGAPTGGKVDTAEATVDKAAPKEKVAAKTA